MMINKANKNQIRPHSGLFVILYIVMWRFYLSALRRFLGRNKIRAKVGQTVCTRYDLYRYKGKLATVVETGYFEYNLGGKHYKEWDIDCAKLKFKKDGVVAYNFTRMSIIS